MGSSTEIRHDCNGRDDAERTVVEYTNGDAATAVVNAISSATGVDPEAFDAQLYDILDPDALDQCLRSGNEDVVVSFTFEGYRVHADGGGSITISPTHA